MKKYDTLFEDKKSRCLVQICGTFFNIWKIHAIISAITDHAAMTCKMEEKHFNKLN